MGRPRTKSPTWLPSRVYPHGAQLIYRPKVGKPIALGPKNDPASCLAAYARLVTDAPAPSTLSDGIDRYMREVLPAKKPRTRETYLEYFAPLRKAFGHMTPADVTINDLYAYHEARGAPVRANREVTVLGMLYRHLIRWRAAKSNPVDGFLYAEEQPRDRVVTLLELRRYNKNAPRWMRVYCLLKLLIGVRQADMLQLGDMAVDQMRGLLRVTIGKSRGSKPKVMEFRLTWALRIVIRAAQGLPRPKTQTLWFVSQKGKTRGQALSQRGFKSAWQRAQERWVEDGGAAFWEHDIRAQAGDAAARRAADLLGHEDEAVTKKHYLRGARRVTPLR